jgi:hypothetical protein
VPADTGVGMTREELTQNLGTIARSGTSEFLAKLESGKSGENLIGQCLWSSLAPHPPFLTDFRQVNSDWDFILGKKITRNPVKYGKLTTHNRFSAFSSQTAFSWPPNRTRVRCNGSSSQRPTPQISNCARTPGAIASGGAPKSHCISVIRPLSRSLVADSRFSPLEF